MKILVSPTPQYIVDDSTEGLFQSESGQYFSYELTYFEPDFVQIKDSAGRTLPVDINEMADLGEMLLRIARFQETSEEVRDYLLNELIHTPTNQTS